MKRSRLAAFLIASCLSAVAWAQQPPPPNPRLLHRPPPSIAMPSVVTPEGRIHLDLVVTDAAGNPITGLQPWDFKLLDNGQPSRILSFRAFNNTNVKPDPPVRVYILLDTANLSFSQVAFMRQQLETFLRADGGKLAQPVSIIRLTDTGFRVQPYPSTEGNELAEFVHRLGPDVRTLGTATGSQGALERLQVSVRQLASIAENNTRIPGRKLLIWLGYGWPIVNGPQDSFSERDQRRYFRAIVELTNWLREARMVLYSVNPTYSSAYYSQTYRAFLKPVVSARQADTGNLALKVLVTQTGGQIMGPSNDIAGQIRACLADSNNFYTISFNPPPPAHADEYHSLKIQVDRPGVAVRTNTGYYDEPTGP